MTLQRAAVKLNMEKSPSLVYGARLELVYGLIAHRGFESLLLRQRKTAASSQAAVFLYKNNMERDRKGKFKWERYVFRSLSEKLF